VPSELRLTRRVQFYETDAAGIVHFSWFFRYMEEAEHGLWRATGLSIARAELGVGFPRVAASFEYHRPLRFEDEVDLRVEINRHTGAYETFRRWTVVEEADLDDPAIETWPSKVAETHPGAKVGDVVEEKIESIEFGRIAAQTAKQVIVQKVREAERAQVVDAYRERLGEIISGTVKKVTRDNVIVDLGNNAEALLAREDIISRETFRVGVRLRALLKEIRTENRGPQLILSRTAPEMLIELFRIEVPEIAEGLIEVFPEFGRGAGPDDRAAHADIPSC